MNRSPALVLFIAILLVWSSVAVCAQNETTTTQDKEQFAQKLRGRVADALGGPQAFGNHSVHWVLLVDTSQYQATAPVADADSEVMEELFRQTIRTGDHVSVLPFQLRPASPTLWNQPVARYEDLRAALPGTTRQEGHQGGRDIEAAVKYALARLESEGEASKAVLLVLSAARFSEVPTGESTYPLTTEHDPTMNAQLAALHSVPIISLVSVPTSQKNGEKVIDLYVRAYIPNPLAGIEARVGPSSVIHKTNKAVPPQILKDASLSERIRRWVFIVLLIIIVVTLLAHFIKKINKNPAISVMPLLVLNHTNRRFPECGLIEVYGNNLSPSTLGTAREPAHISLDNPDLPDAVKGHLFTLSVDKRTGIVITPHLYTAEPSVLPIDQETSVHMIPAEGVDGFPVQMHITVRR